MPPDNLGTIRSLYATYNDAATSGDVVPLVTDHFAADCEYRPVEEADPVRGHAALILYFERWLEAWQAIRIDIDELVESGATIFAAIRIEGRGAGSGTDISQTFFHVIELRDGRIVRGLEYLDRAPALEAAGLSG